MATVPSALIAWLLDSDPALRWQVERDLLGEPSEVWEATRATVATEGFGARRRPTLDAEVLRERRTVELLAENRLNRTPARSS